MKESFRVACDQCDPRQSYVMRSFFLWLTFASFLGVGRAEDSRGLLLQEAEAEANTEMVKWLEQIHHSLAEQSKKLEQRLAKVENQADTSARLYDFRCHYFQKRVKSFQGGGRKRGCHGAVQSGALLFVWGGGGAQRCGGGKVVFGGGPAGTWSGQKGVGRSKDQLKRPAPTPLATNEGSDSHGSGG